MKLKTILIVAFLLLPACGGDNAVRETAKASPGEAKQLTAEQRSIEQAANEAAKLVEADSVTETRADNTDQQ